MEESPRDFQMKNIREFEVDEKEGRREVVHTYFLIASWSVNDNHDFQLDLTNGEDAWTFSHRGDDLSFLPEHFNKSWSDFTSHLYDVFFPTSSRYATYELTLTQRPRKEATVSWKNSDKSAEFALFKSKVPHKIVIKALHLAQTRKATADESLQISEELLDEKTALYVGTRDETRAKISKRIEETNKMLIMAKLLLDAKEKFAADLEKGDSHESNKPETSKSDDTTQRKKKKV